MTGWRRERLLGTAALALFLGAWWAGSRLTQPVLVPSPVATWEATLYLLETRLLQESVAVSALRILSGWVLGGAIGVPIGLLIGHVRGVRLFLTPYVEGLRFIPPVAFVSVFMVWFGTGEASKVLLLVYTTLFIMVLNTTAGVISIKPGTLRAARCLGASERQILLRVIVPETVPYIVTGLRIALANAFITIVAAEMIAARSGVGYLIWSSRNFMLTDQVFVGVVVIGLMGFVMDRAFHIASRTFLARFGVA